MKTTILPENDIELHNAFQAIVSNGNFNSCITDIAELIYNDNLNPDSFKEVLENHDIEKPQDIKENLLDLLINYIKIVLDDHAITDVEKKNVGLLKLLFKIKEGDFYKYRYYEIGDILRRQFKLLYEDNDISKEEAIYKVELQDFFDLSYDQFDLLKENEIRRALSEGADIKDLNTGRIPKQ